MAFTQITGDNISTATNATITALAFQNTNSVLSLPAGTTAQRPTTPALGSIRYNSDDDNAEIYIQTLMVLVLMDGHLLRVVDLL